MKNVLILLICLTAFGTSAFAASDFDMAAGVPFTDKKIHPFHKLDIHYNNKAFWDGVVCSCTPQQGCSSYTAEWKFKGQTHFSQGPNHYDKLILNFGFSPEAPPQDADLKGMIRIINTGTQIIHISCRFEFSS